MKMGIIVQARMSSSRLPGKVLRCLGGREMIGLLLDSLGQCREIHDLIVATSRHRTDDPVAGYCQARGIDCYRGPLSKVAQRFVETAEKYDLEAFVRLCADSPLLDHRLVDRAVTLFRADGRTDLAGNIFPRSFPKGQSVEVMRTRTLVEALDKFSHPDHQEHVTRYFYENPDGYGIVNFSSGQTLPEVSLSVDTQEDFERVQRILEAMDRPHWQYTWREKTIMALNGASC